MQLDFVEVESILQQNAIPVAKHVRLDNTDKVINLPQDMLGEHLNAKVTYADGLSEQVEIPPQFGQKFTLPLSTQYNPTIRSIYIQKRPHLNHTMTLLVRTDRRNGKIKMVATSITDDMTSALHINIFIGLRDYQLRYMASEMNLPGVLWQSFFDIAHKLYQIYYERAAEAVHVHKMGATAQNTFQVIDADITVHDEDTNPQPQRPFVVDVHETYDDAAPQILCIVNGTVVGLGVLDEIQHQAPQQGAKLVNIGYMGTPADLLTTLSLNYGGLSIKTQLIIIFASEYDLSAYQQILIDIDYAKYRDNTILYLHGRPSIASEGPSLEQVLSKYVTVASSLEEAVALSLQANRRS